MRILHVNNFQDGFGTGKYIKRIMAKLNEAGHDNRLFVQKVTIGNNPFLALKNTKENCHSLQKTIKQFEPDIIHIHNVTNYKSLQFLLQAKPCLKSIHEYRPFCIRDRIRQSDRELCARELSLECFTCGCLSLHALTLYRFFADKRGMEVIKEIKHVLVYSRYMQNVFEPFLKKQTLIHRFPLFFDAPCPDSDPVPKEKRIFAAGRLVPEKGFDHLIKAIRQAEVQCEVRIAGEGPERKNLETLALESGVTIEFLGYIPASELDEQYQWCRMTAFPSIYPEPFGLVGLEAMGAGRPIAGYAAGGVPDWLFDEKNGILVPHGNISALASAIREILTNDDLAQKMGSEGRTILQNEFNSHKHIQLLEQLYQQIIND